MIPVHHVLYFGTVQGNTLFLSVLVTRYVAYPVITVKYVVIFYM